jgi:hypothetical protein
MAHLETKGRKAHREEVQRLMLERKRRRREELQAGKVWRCALMADE